MPIRPYRKWRGAHPRRARPAIFQFYGQNPQFCCVHEASPAGFVKRRGRNTDLAVPTAQPRGRIWRGKNVIPMINATGRGPCFPQKCTSRTRLCETDHHFLQSHRHKVLTRNPRLYIGTPLSRLGGRPSPRIVCASRLNATVPKQRTFSDQDRWRAERQAG